MTSASAAPSWITSPSRRTTTRTVSDVPCALTTTVACPEPSGRSVAGVAVSVGAAGGVVSTVSVRLAGGLSTLPAASVDRIASVWPPSPRSATSHGAVHGANAPPSTLQSIDTVSGSAENSTANAPPAIACGAVVTCVAGATLSTVTVALPPGGEATPWASTAITL